MPTDGASTWTRARALGGRGQGRWRESANHERPLPRKARREPPAHTLARARAATMAEEEDTKPDPNQLNLKVVAQSGEEVRHRAPRASRPAHMPAHRCAVPADLLQGEAVDKVQQDHEFLLCVARPILSRRTRRPPHALIPRVDSQRQHWCGQARGRTSRATPFAFSSTAIGSGPSRRPRIWGWRTTVCPAHPCAPGGRHVAEPLASRAQTRSTSSSSRSGVGRRDRCPCPLTSGLLHARLGRAPVRPRSHPAHAPAPRPRQAGTRAGAARR